MKGLAPYGVGFTRKQPAGRGVLQMEIVVQVVGLGLIAALLALILKEYRPELAMQVSLVAGVIIMLLVLRRIVTAVNVITETAVAAGINLVYLQTLLRVIGIAYLAEFGAQLCRDAGEGSIASRVELAAKVIILVMAVPVIIEIMESVLGMIPQ